MAAKRVLRGLGASAGGLGQGQRPSGGVKGLKSAAIAFLWFAAIEELELKGEVSAGVGGDAEGKVSESCLWRENMGYEGRGRVLRGTEGG